MRGPARLKKEARGWASALLKVREADFIQRLLQVSAVGARHFEAAENPAVGATLGAIVKERDIPLSPEAAEEFPYRGLFPSPPLFDRMPTYRTQGKRSLNFLSARRRRDRALALVLEARDCQVSLRFTPQPARRRRSSRRSAPAREA